MDLDRKLIQVLEDQIVELGAAAGFDVVEQWIHADARFALTLFRAS